MTDHITEKEQKVPKYEYLAVYEGQIKARIPFDTAKEAKEYYAKQSAGLSPCDPHRVILRKKGKTIKDSWHVD